MRASHAINNIYKLTSFLNSYIYISLLANLAWCDDTMQYNIRLLQLCWHFATVDYKSNFNKRLSLYKERERRSFSVEAMFSSLAYILCSCVRKLHVYSGNTTHAWPLDGWAHSDWHL